MTPGVVPEGRDEGRTLTILCGDSTCDSYGCSQQALDAWHQRQQDEARFIVRSLLGLPVTEGDNTP